jgi:hypothetical protein
MRVDEPLRPEERRLVETLRAIPESPLRQRLLALVSELLDFVSQPGCTEMQADGAPCSSAQAACDQCHKLTQLLDGLRTRLQDG